MTDILILGGTAQPVIVSGPAGSVVIDEDDGGATILPPPSGEATIVNADSSGPAIIPTATGTQGPAGPAGSGSTISVKEEDSLLSSAVERLNFEGYGVSASVAGSEATITVPGTTPFLLTFDAGGGVVPGGSFNGSAAVTVSFDSVGAQPVSDGLTSLAGLAWTTGVKIPVLTAADTFALRNVGAASASDILDRAAGDARYEMAGGGGGGLSDGDYGDITVGGTGTSLTIDADTVDNTKLANMAQSTLKGRASGAGTGDPTDLSVAQVKTILALAAADISGLAAIATSGSGADLGAGTVTLAKVANIANNRILGNVSGSAAAPSELTAAQVKTLLAIAAADVSGLAYFATGTDAGNLTGTVAAARLPAFTGGDVTSSAGSAVLTIGNGSVSLAKMANVATATVFYRKTAGTGAPEVQTLATLKSDLGLTGTNSGDQTITLTGPVTGSGTGSFATTIAANAVTRANLAATSGAAILGATGAGNVTDLTAAQAKAFLAITTADVSGLPTFREVLTADRTYYVRTDGNNSNNGLANTSGGAFLTIQKAIDSVYALDLNGKQVTIQVADGTYTSPIVITGALLGGTHSSQQPLKIIGNETTPSNVVISMTNATALSLTRAYALIAGMKFQTTTGGFGWLVSDHSLLEHRNCVFGSVVSDMIFCGYNSIVRAISGTLTVAASATASAFVHIVKRSLVSFTNTTIAFNSNTFSQYLWGLNDATLDLDSATITGIKTGGIAVHDASLINAYSLTGSYFGGVRPIVEDQSAIVGDEYSARTYYVRADGNDANDGLGNSSARAFRQIQAALDWLFDLSEDPAYKVAGSGAVINVGAGTYAGFNLRDSQYDDVTITGDTTTPGNVIVNGATDGIVALGTNTNWLIQGMKLTASSGHCIRAERGSKIDFNAIAFNTATSAHIYAVTGAIVRAAGNYSIVGGAAWHIYQQQSIGDINSRTVTLTGTPAFSQAFAALSRNSSLLAYSMTFSGAATGKRYDVTGNSTLDSNAGVLPGSVPGTTATGGQYL